VLAYEVTLLVLLRFFTHTDETDEQLKVLVDGALTLMSRVLRPLATALTTLPVGPDHPDRTTGFAFEMYYLMGNTVPYRESSWALLAERAGVLVRRCAEATGDETGPTLEAVRTAGEQARTVAEALLAHVPAELQPSSGGSASRPSATG